MISVSQIMIVCLEPNAAQIAFCVRTPKNGFVLGDQNYAITESTGWSGFYDWLRPRKGQVAGVRFWPYEWARFILEPCRFLPYVNVKEGNIELLFVSSGFDEAISDDQSFADNTIYESLLGQYAIAFSLYGLTDIEIRGLHSLPNTKLEVQDY